MTGAGFAVVVLLALVSPFVLWLLIDSETDRTEVMDRASAERTVRTDSYEGKSGDSRDERRNGDRWND
ncbi:MAG: hypothetical protein ABEI77_09540 [Halorientalis sp.]